MWIRWVGVALTCVPWVVCADVTVSDNPQKWAPMTVTMDSAPLSFAESDINPNPFLDYRYEVLFQGPSDQQYRVPGFFAGNGQGHGEGSIWRVRFSPDQTGTWTYRISFRTGDNVSVNLAPYAGDPVPAQVGIQVARGGGDDGLSGSFHVADVSADAGKFLTWGRLDYDGSHYLKHADGPYFVKGGVDSPENFFGFAGFDNTIDHKGGAGSAGLTGGLHRYPSHVDDWVEGDPDFFNAATGESGRAIIGAVNYLASERVNSLYFLPMNLGGDGRETFPFVGSSGSDFDNTHYDISKLYQWNLVLNHMQEKDVAAHIVLAEQEPLNTAWLDDGELGVQRKLYYRELVARFGYLLALKWNLSEESRYGAERHRSFATYLRALDWAQHPVAVHTRRDRPEEAYDDILGDTLFDITSIQYSPGNGDDFVERYRAQSAQSGWPWVIDMDEIGAPQVGLTDTNANELRKLVLYPVYFSGGNLEWYFGYHNLPLGGDIRTEDFRTREAMYRYMWIARDFMQTHLPFWLMQPDDTLHTLPASQSASYSVSLGADGDSTPLGDVQVFLDDGQTYAVYLPVGDVGGVLSVLPGTYTLRWFNPRDGRFYGQDQLISTGDGTPRVAMLIEDPPMSPQEDWVILVQRAVDGNDGASEQDSSTDTAVTQSNTEVVAAAALTGQTDGLAVAQASAEWTPDVSEPGAPEAGEPEPSEPEPGAATLNTLPVSQSGAPSIVLLMLLVFGLKRKVRELWR